MTGKVTIFTEEIIHSFEKDGKIESSFPAYKVGEFIANSLSNQIRFNGITDNLPYNIMTHSFLVSMLAYDFALVAGICDSARLAEVELCGLLHDVGETIVGDVIYPLKSGNFRQPYEKTYLPIEIAFREWVAEKVYGIVDFHRMWNDSERFVNEADVFAGKMELFGISAIAEWHSADCFTSLFCELIDKDFLQDDFEEKIDILKKKTEGRTIQ